MNLKCGSTVFAENGDVNGDGKVGLADVIRVMKLIE